MTSSLWATCRPTFLCCCRAAHARHLSFSAASAPHVLLRRSPLLTSPPPPPSRAAGYRRTLTRVSNWSSDKSPYDTLELGRDADDDKIKSAYRRLAKFYHPDVYDGRGTLEEGETAEARFIKIQAAYELLIDEEKRGHYDRDHRVNPMKASKAWMEWLIKKRKAFDQRGDVAIVAWAEQQQRELNLRARRLSRSKIDPDEERKILAKEKKAMAYFSSTLKRHTLILKKRDLMRKQSEEDKQKIIKQLLAAEGLELDTDEEEV